MTLISFWIYFTSHNWIQLSGRIWTWIFPPERQLDQMGLGYSSLQPSEMSLYLHCWEWHEIPLKARDTFKSKKPPHSQWSKDWCFILKEIIWTRWWIGCITPKQNWTTSSHHQSVSPDWGTRYSAVGSLAPGFAIYYTTFGLQCYNAWTTLLCVLAQGDVHYTNRKTAIAHR